MMTMSHAHGQYMSMADCILVLGNTGEIIERGPYSILKDSASVVAVIDQSEEGAAYDDSTPTDKATEDPSSSDVTGESQAESQRLYNPDLSVWRFYFDTMGWAKIALLCMFLSAEGGFGVFRYVWLTWWSASDDAISSSRLGYWIGIYASLGALELTGLALGTFWTWVVIVPEASRKLHLIVLDTTMKAPMTFLSNTDIGHLINRFSQDMRLIDVVLPSGFISTAFQLFGTAAQAAVAVAALPYLAAAVPFVVVILVLIQRFYLRTSRQLRTLDIEMKAPIFSHFIESLHGLVTIRAFGWTTQSMEKTICLLDVAQRPYYLLLSVQRWLVLVLNLVVAGMVILLLGLGVALRDRVNPGLFGVALVMMTTLGQMIADLIQAWTQLETSLTAVSRIKSFAENTPQETEGSETTFLDEDWPPLGGIRFESVYANYDDTSGSVLENINLSILPGQKVGICGRTGRLAILDSLPQLTSGEKYAANFLL